ncbi:MAG: PSD1 domain-containing protein [Planctomycetes bacterium]|nr:PSD1 domain-containing protein [Planctomycetota bacterium]
MWNLCRAVVCPAFLLCIIGLGSSTSRAAEAPDYGRDVRPILSQFCFKCHGPDETKREAGLRLDLRDEAIRAAGSGERPIVPTEPAASEMIRRIHSTDPDEQMPPPSTKQQLSLAQKEILRQWIAAGAEYKPHWSFVPPQRPALPAVKLTSWPRRGLDNFVLHRLEAEQMSPSSEADRYTLIRRLSLDLIGLPPTPDEADEFVADSSPDACEKWIDRLQASPHYGERWARRWLDLARYADTNGYEKDRGRSIWPYRDWVIQALNGNLPFDQFTIEQLAGDMLPGATQDQRIATGFHRNTMLNEEGGIDPLEFRFYAMTDRVATTATVWLGLTVGCAQCHTHKYDPITHRDYYGMFALLNNADEPEIDVIRPEIAARRHELEQRIAALQAQLPNRFPLQDEFDWKPIQPVTAKSSQGATLEPLGDGTVFVSGTNPESDTYELEFDSELADVTAVRLEVLSDSRLPGKGPGRTPHGNFVLSEITGRVSQKDLKFVRATADFAQDQFPVDKAIDGQTTANGWAIHGPGEWNVNRTAVFVLDAPTGKPEKPVRWTIRLTQAYGKQHTIGKFRLSLGTRRPSSEGSEAERRRAHLNQKFGEWLAVEQGRVVSWTKLRPTAAASNLPLLTIQPDHSIVATGDMSKRDTYDIKFAAATEQSSASKSRWTAIRIEALPDGRSPKNGPGRVYYEGPFGDFFLSEVTLKADGQPVKLTAPSQSFANGGNTAAMALDGNQQTGWSINGGQGKAHVAVFRFEQPVERSSQFDLSLLFERYYAAGLGRVRVSVTDDPRPVEASPLPMELESIVLTSRDAKSDDKSMWIDRYPQLLPYFCEVAPELAAERQAIANLRSQLPAFPTTLAFHERPASNPRQTHRYHRGEFLQPKEVVEPAVLSALPQLPRALPANRLTFARWLVSADNPLGARVAVNREWTALFGRGLVRSVEDFGSQGTAPTNPALLDWLAVELSGNQSGVQNWDLKRLHRMIVSSSTYRQSSRVTPELLAKDPTNEWLARGPRQRLEAEILRDTALQASGLLSHKLYGPSVFPPQPSSVTTEGTYGGLAWNVSPGEDRYRRTMYTFSKRTSPFAMSLTFDGPSGEACVARREVTNTPLQALTLLNDTVFVEASQALGREFAARDGSVDQRLALLFRRCVTRPAAADELAVLKQFFDDQETRLQNKQLDAKALAGAGAENEIARAAWTIVARAILNLDEAVTKN